MSWSISPIPRAYHGVVLRAHSRYVGLNDQLCGRSASSDASYMPISSSAVFLSFPASGMWIVHSAFSPGFSLSRNTLTLGISFFSSTFREMVTCSVKNCSSFTNVNCAVTPAPYSALNGISNVFISSLISIQRLSSAFCPCIIS